MSEATDNRTKEKCYACGRQMKSGPTSCLTVYLIDDGHAAVHVGPDCFRHVVRGGATGYQPPRGGPRLFATKSEARSYAEASALYHGDIDGDFNYW